MKIASALQRTTSEFDQRKRAMDQAYRKHAKFAEASKNPLQVAMENLLSGKTEKEIHQHEFEETVLNAAYVEQEQLQTEQQVQTEAANQPITDFALTNKFPESNETIDVLEQVREAALAPVNPSPQDLRVAASATAQIQVERGEISVESEEVEPFANESLQVDIPERFLNEVVREPAKETVFGQNIEQQLFTRTFNKAKSIYTSHIDMVKNSYRSYNEPKFSITA